MVQEREADLRLFVEVATQSCLPAGREGQELAQARVAEAKLKEQVRGGGLGLARVLWMRGVRDMLDAHFTCILNEILYWK